MKRCKKLPEPQALANYRQAQPESTWQEMRDDPFHGGQSAYHDVKQDLVRGQRCLCAFCETRIAAGTLDDEIESAKSRQRVEHFHPKEDTNRPPNWALHWSNLWALCHGGSDWPPSGEPLDPDRHLEPLTENLSCDAFKDRQITAGNLPSEPEGWIMAPGEVPLFPPLFRFAPDGTPEPHLRNCSEALLPSHQYDDTATLVAKTIEHLNLGCARLNRSRCIAKAQLEKRIAKARQQNPGVPPRDALLILARRLFPPDPTIAWPEFFSLLRWRLGEPAEEHLQSISFIG